MRIREKLNRTFQFLSVHFQRHAIGAGWYAEINEFAFGQAGWLVDPGVELQSDETLAVSDHLTGLGLRHPDVQIKDMEIEVGTLQLKVLTNQSRPELNLVGSYGHNGLGSDWSEAGSR